MGFELEKFVSKIDEELKCSICCGVLQNAVQICECEHTFCSECIQEWIKRQSKCPIDRRDITTESLKPASRLLNSFLNRLEVRCDFNEFGCNSIISLESLTSHTSHCNFNPDKSFVCDKGCGLMLTLRQKLDHNCVLEDILINIENLNEKIRKVEKLTEKEVKELHKRIETLEQKCETTDALERKYASLEKKFELLVSKLSSLRISLGEDLEIDENRNDNQINVKRGNKCLIRAQQTSSPLRTISIEVDHKNKTIEMFANIREPIRNIKSRIREQEDMSVDSQCLFYKKVLLDNEKTLEDYSIESMNFLLVKRPIRVDIILFTENISFLLEPFDTISQLKERIYKSKGFNVSISYFGQTLDENRTFYSYKIRDRAKLKVTAIECKTDGSHCNGSHRTLSSPYL